MRKFGAGANLAIIVDIVDIHRPLGVDDVDGNVIWRIEFGHQVHGNATVDEDNQPHQADIVLKGLT